MFKRQAFTLAEVLITLGVIGIVAALTIPTLIKNIQDAGIQEAWKKNYSIIAQAYERAKLEEGNNLSQYFYSGSNFLGGTTEIANKMGEYLSYINKCGIPNTASYANICGSIPTQSINGTYKTLADVSITYPQLGHGQYVLKDGTNLYFRTYNTSGEFIVFADVNGYKKGPNILGRDLLGLTVTPDKVIPMGANGTGAENTCNTTVFVGLNNSGFMGGEDISGAGCSAELLYK